MTARLTTLLLELPRTYTELLEAHQGVRSGEGERVSGGGGLERPIPVDGMVADHRQTILHGLRSWVVYLTDGEGRDLLDSVPHMCAVLAGFVPWLEPDVVDELTKHVLAWQRGARSRMDLPTMRVSLPVGKCPESEGEHWQCPGVLYAMVPADRDRLLWLECKGGCASRWEVTELPGALDVVVPVGVAAQLLGVTERTVQRRSGDARADGMVRLGDAVNG